eukprot:scaffold4888_cov104-Skeletonema_marinoi.AAC.5
MGPSAYRIVLADSDLTPPDLLKLRSKAWRPYTVLDGKQFRQITRKLTSKFLRLWCKGEGYPPRSRVRH